MSESKEKCLSPVLSLQRQSESTVTLTVRDLLEDKLSRRTKDDMAILKQMVDKQSDWKYPCLVKSCGHSCDFMEMIDFYRDNQQTHQWKCPVCFSVINGGIKNIRVFRDSDFFTRILPLSAVSSSNSTSSLISRMVFELESQINSLTLTDSSSNLNNSKIENIFNEVTQGKVLVEKHEFDIPSLPNKSALKRNRKLF